MPSRNTIKEYDTDTFYYVYNRGAGGQSIFLDVADKRKFMNLFRRHLLQDADDDIEQYKKYTGKSVGYDADAVH